MVVFPLVFCNLDVDTLKVFEKNLFGKCFKRKRFVLHYLAVQDKYFQATGYMV